MIDVTAAVLIKSNKIFIAKRPPGDLLAGKWELPGGKIELGESPEQCLKREIQEEFGIVINVHNFLAENIYHYNHISIRLLAYQISWESGSMLPVAHDEIAWSDYENLDSFDFAPADIPIISEIKKKIFARGEK